MLRKPNCLHFSSKSPDCLPDGSGVQIRIDRTHSAASWPVTSCHECAWLSNLDKRRQEEAQAPTGLLSQALLLLLLKEQGTILANLVCSYSWICNSWFLAFDNLKQNANKWTYFTCVFSLSYVTHTVSFLHIPATYLQLIKQHCCSYRERIQQQWWMYFCKSYFNKHYIKRLQYPLVKAVETQYGPFFLFCTEWWADQCETFFLSLSLSLFF
jgi:hypothetical protein